MDLDRIRQILELTTISALLDSPDSVKIIPPGEVTTNIGRLYYQRPKKKFPYKISKDKTGKTKVGYITPVQSKLSKLPPNLTGYYKFVKKENQMDSKMLRKIFEIEEKIDREREDLESRILSLFDEVDDITRSDLQGIVSVIVSDAIKHGRKLQQQEEGNKNE